MIEKGRISPFELSILVVFFTIGTTILAIPAVLTTKVNQDAWLSSLIAIAGCVVLAFFFSIFAGVMGRETFIQYLERVYGKIFGKMIGVTYVYFSFIGACSLFYQFGNFISTQMLVDTPVEVFNIMLGILVITVVRAGIEVLARTGELLIPWFMFLFCALVVLLIPQIQIERLSPIYEGNLPVHFSAALDFIAFSAFPLVVFLFFFPGSINRPDKTRMNFMAGAFIGSFIIGILVLLCILVLGASATARQIFPTYVLAKTVSVFDIIERIEAVMASMWILSLFFKCAIYFYGMIISSAEILEVKNFRFLVIPIGIMTLVFSTVIYPDVVYINNWDDKYWAHYSMIMGLLIPLITLIIDKIKSRFTVKAGDSPPAR